MWKKISERQTPSGEQPQVSYRLDFNFGSAFLTRDNKYYPNHWVLTCDAIGIPQQAIAINSEDEEAVQQTAIRYIENRVKYIALSFENWQSRANS